jgi:uncharacterized protein YybS (DUF2232 family)
VTSEAAASDKDTAGRPVAQYLILAAIVAYSVLAFGSLETRLGGPIVLLTAIISYFLCMFVFYGIARLAFRQYTRVLWGGVLAALTAGFLLSGPDVAWTLLTGWGMLLLAGAATGRLTRAGYLQSQVYMIGAAIVTVLFALQAWPLWQKFIASAPEMVDGLTEQWRQLLTGMGASEQAARENLDQVRRAAGVMVHLFPAATILAALVQFSVGYLAFVVWADRQDPPGGYYVPFTRWKVPFGFTPLVLIAVVARLLGGELPKLVADNALVILGMYYCVAGLALIEYYLTRLRMSKLMKIIFYLLLLFTQLAGFLVAVLAGFVDSFADWRSRHLQQEV